MKPYDWREDCQCGSQVKRVEASGDVLTFTCVKCGRVWKRLLRRSREKPTAGRGE